MNIKLLEQLKIHEGFRKNFYLCSAGKKTIGYGRNVEANPRFNGRLICEPMLKDCAEQILIYDINSAIDLLDKTWGYFSSIEDSPRKDVLINLCFNIGIKKFMGFKKVRLAVSLKDWETAANEMKNSEWYGQVGDRGIELVDQMRSGKYK